MRRYPLRQWLGFALVYGGGGFLLQASNPSTHFPSLHEVPAPCGIVIAAPTSQLQQQWPAARRGPPAIQAGPPVAGACVPRASSSVCSAPCSAARTQSSSLAASCMAGGFPIASAGRGPEAGPTWCCAAVFAGTGQSHSRHHPESSAAALLHSVHRLCAGPPQRPPPQGAHLLDGRAQGGQRCRVGLRARGCPEAAHENRQRGLPEAPRIRKRAAREGEVV